MSQEVEGGYVLVAKCRMCGYAWSFNLARLACPKCECRDIQLLRGRIFVRFEEVKLEGVMV